VNTHLDYFVVGSHLVLRSPVPVEIAEKSRATWFPLELSVVHDEAGIIFKPRDAAWLERLPWSAGKLGMGRQAALDLIATLVVATRRR
jgi:hypothetical protein